MVKVTKSQAELYQVRHETFEGWGDIHLVCGEQSVSVVIHSDYGTFAKYWSHCGCNPKKFLVDLDFDYCMKNLTDYKHYIKAPEQYPTEVKGRIIEARRAENLTKEEAREAWCDMLQTEFDEGDLYFKELIDHHLFNKVFGDYEYLPCAKKIDPCCQELWEMVWLPFVERLKSELNLVSSLDQLAGKLAWK
ncbi:hypothetical protein DET48_11461 [Vibrio diazotrophicus]|jgi:hypothetical protein|uniref:Uncharacterized protein n=1 Tax=Vibrio diazotrophicus TaxID=685 RepID=A0A329EA39_VIBDI|nr:hypothetical protein [Vibrio diazotrophicus]RAS62666.1 hypothetical protein DET48_11461 [Vibrio diazotrophicus]